MDAELKDRPGRKRTGLVDRLYDEQLGASDDVDPYSDPVYRKYVLEKKANDPYVEQVGPGTGIMRGIEDFLGKNVAEPLGRAGYPRVGAAAAAIPATVADLAIPQTAGDYAGALIPFGKAGKALKAGEELGAKVLSKEEMAAKRAAQNRSILREERLKRPGMAEEGQPLTAREKFAQRIAPKEPEQNATQRVLDRFGGEEHPLGAKLKKIIEDEGARVSEPYVGADAASPIYQDHPLKSLPQPLPASQVTDVRGHLGKEVAKGGADPFAWMDSKYGVSKNILEQNADKPLKISTRSDLIAHDDYISKLNPNLHEVEFHVPTSNRQVSRVLAPGAPSLDRQLVAIKKLQNHGIPVSIVHDKIKGLPPELGGLDQLEMARAGVNVPIKTNEINPPSHMWDVLGMTPEKSAK